MMKKKCNKCNHIKSIQYFYRNSHSPDGYRSTCKSCHGATIKKYGKTPQGRAARKRAYRNYSGSEKDKERARRHYKTGKRLITWRTASRTMRKKYPIKHKARDAVKYAIKRGKLPHPTTLNCAHCNLPAREYHHHRGYKRGVWLDVVPLCKSCHIIAN